MRLARSIPVVVVVVAVLTVSSLWGHRVIAERLADSSFTTAQSNLLSDIRSARADGLFPSELHRFSTRLSAIEAATPPGDSSFWSTSHGDFYSGETSKLNQADRQLRTLVSRATVTARSHARWLLWRYGKELAIGHSHGLTLKSEEALLARDRSNLAKATTAGQYRAIAGTSQPQLQALERTVHQRVIDMARITAAARASAHPIPTIRRIIASHVASAKQDLQTLRIFIKRPGFGRWLYRLSHWAFSQTHVRAAEVGAADVAGLAAKIHDRLAQVAPSKWILVSTEGEWMSWYQGTHMVGTSLVTTGNPSLPTVKGHFKILVKLSPFTFVSSDPPSSPDWYPPSPVSYAMLFQDAGYFIHDAPWRSAFGPGTDGGGQPGTDSGGTHGCVNVPLNVAAFLYGWAPVGTPVIVI